MMNYIRSSDKANPKNRITEAALGYEGAWWVRFADGSSRWDFGSHYTELNWLLRQGVVSDKSINVSCHNFTTPDLDAIPRY
jgi:hypothetical protein